MSSSPVLAQPDFIKAQSGDNPFVLFTDACKEGVGGVLCQKGLDGFLHPLYFISKGLTKAEKNYSITDLEGLAVVHAVQRLQSVLYNMHFTVKTDHQPLTSFFKTGKNDRVLRWALALQSYGQKMKIEYVPGKENVVADALSRFKRSGDSSSLTCEGEPEDFLVSKVVACLEKAGIDWLAELRLDDVYKELIKSVETGEEGVVTLSGMQKKVRIEDFSILEGFLWFIDSLGSKKKVVPKSLREKLYEEIHSGVFAGHFSAKKVCEVLKRSYFWECLPRDVAKWHQKCTKCYLVNAKGVNTPPLKPVLKGKPFELVGVDLLDLGLTESGNKYALVLVDSFSKWMAAYPIASKTADEVAETIVSRWICDGARWPQQFLSDMGTEFMNKVIEQVKKVMGVDWVTTKGYNPRENGLVERANGTILRALKKKMVAGVTWDKLLPFVVYSYNTTPHTSTGESPYFLLHGMDPPSVVSCDVPEISKYIADVEDYRTILVEGVRVAREMARECMEREMGYVKEYYDKVKNVHEKWQPNVGDKVYVRKPENQIRSKLEVGFSGPMRVVEKSENSALVVDLNGKREPIRLPFDWLLRVPEMLTEEKTDDSGVRRCKGRPRIKVNRVFYRVIEKRPFCLDFECVGEALNGRVRRAESLPCDLFSKPLGSVISGLPNVLGAIRVSSLGHLVHIYCLVRRCQNQEIFEPYLMREAAMAVDDQPIVLADVVSALAAAAGGCIHVDMMLQENKLFPVQIQRSENWPVLTDVIKEGLRDALQQRNRMLRGPAEQLKFVARGFCDKLPQFSDGQTFVFDNYKEIAVRMEAKGAKPIEVTVFVGDGLQGEVTELLPSNVVDGTSIALCCPPFGLISDSTLEATRLGAEDVSIRMSQTPAKFSNLLPRRTEMTSFMCLGKVPIKEGFDRIDKAKLALYVDMLMNELANKAFPIRGNGLLGVRDESSNTVAQRVRGGGSSRGGRAFFRGDNGHRGSRGGGRAGGLSGRGPRGKGGFLHRTMNGGV